MTPSPARVPLPYRWLSLLLGLALVAVGAASAIWWPQVTSAATRLTAVDPVTAAIEKVRAAGSYHFTSDVTQVTLPVANIYNVGRSNRTEQYYLEGESDLRAERLAMTLWSNSGNILHSANGVAIKVEEGKTWLRANGGDWQEREGTVETFAPTGDFMAYLKAIKEVVAHAPETRKGITFTRYTFVIDGPRFASYLREILEKTLRARGELPAGLHLADPVYYRDMEGEGELWVGENGLPLRQILTLRFPEQEGEQIHTQLTTDFSKIGVPAMPAAGSVTQPWLQPWLKHALPVTMSLLVALGVLALVILYGHSRVLYNALAVAVISSMVISPLLTTSTTVRFFNTQSAKAAEQKAQQASAQDEHDLRAALGRTEFNPHLNPLETGDLTQESSQQSPAANRQSAPAAQLTDNGTDTDGDLLTDFTEDRIGTNPSDPDGDGDSLNDNIELAGFSFGGQQWYLNPNASDSNSDGQSDGLEWGLNTDGTLRTTPQDTDGDGLPDLFDPDNDNDGVPDNVDVSSFSMSSATFSESVPLQLKLNNLAANQPTLVEFQLRPQDPKQLWFAMNVLDWPQDSEGQMQDVDNKTYADVAAAAGRTPGPGEENGDMRAIPMLEIRIPTASANLPPQSDLSPFNISVNNFTADGNTKVAYVPLSVVTNDRSGERVAFSGQMRYLPTGAWADAHSVRLAWVIQGLVDLPCDKNVDTSVDCQADGIRNNVPTILQSYYSDWSLTGLMVREERGTDTAIVYEDPTSDPDLTDDPAIWGLAHVLDGHFVNPRDANNDGVRDLKLSDFPARFDRDNNPTAVQRFDIPNLLQVETHSYSTVEQAVAATTMTDTVQILNSQFATPVSNNRAIKPLLLFAQEMRQRTLTLDLRNVGGSYVTQTGAALTLDMAPSGQPAQDVAVSANVKWQAYCAPATGAVTFTPCTDEDYWAALDARYANLASLPTDQDPTWVTSRLALAQVYYVSLRVGYLATVQDGALILSGRYALEDEANTATAVRATLLGLSTVPLLAAQNMTRLFVLFTGQNSFRVFVYKFGHDMRQKIVEARQVLSDPDADAFDIKDAKEDLAGLKKLRLRFNLAKVGAAASVLMVIGQIATLWPGLSEQTRIGIGAVTVILTAGLTVVLPAISFAASRFATTSNVPKIATVLGVNGARYSALFTRASAIGAVFSVALIWGFFIYGAVTSGLAPGSPALIRAAVEAIAATIITLLLIVLSINPIGALISAVLGLVDLILTLLCETGHDELRNVPGLGGACFTLTTAITKIVAGLIYNYEMMVNLRKDDLMVTGAPDLTLTDPSKGFVAGNTYSLTLPVTTTVHHQRPGTDEGSGPIIVYYPYLFSADNLKSSTFRYKLYNPASETGATAVDLNQMPSDWQNVAVEENYLNFSLYRGQATALATAPANNPLVAGINAKLPLKLGMSYAIPAYECWVLLLIPVCYVKEFEGSTTDIPLDSLRYDVFPASLAEFLTLGSKPDGGRGLAWDARFGSLVDGDGDGLRSTLFNGLDPDDTTWDADNDGLSDAAELQIRQAGEATSPLVRDTDNDGLSDLQEITIGSDPAVADTDNDGLADGVETRHQVLGADGKLTTTWAGGWQVTINSNPARTIWVSSSPFSADSDEDGISDQAERGLASQLDSQNRPYHPSIYNTSPLAVVTASSDLDGYLAPNQSFQYTSTVIASVPMAPGVLNVTVPTILGTAPNPTSLLFNPGASTSQTMTVASNFTVAANAANQSFTLTSTASTRLPNSSAAQWSWTPATTESVLNTAGRSSAFMSGAASRPDRQDRYRLLGQAIDLQNTFFNPGNVIAYDLSNGTSRNLEVDAANPAWRGDTAPAIACNDLGVCLAAWSEKPGGTGGPPVRIGAALLAADGTVQRTFAVTAPALPIDSDSTPVVASDGVNFLVAWQRLDAYNRQLSPTSSTISFRTDLMTRLYDGAGAPLTGETTLTGDQLEFWSANINVTSALNAIRSRLNRIDLDWVGDRYRLTRGIHLGNTIVNDPTLLSALVFTDNGTTGNRRLLTWRDINASGALITGSKATVYTDASNDANASINLVYNPSTNEVLLVQTNGFSVLAQQFSSPAVTSAGTTLIAGAAANAVATYYAPQRGYLIGWTDTSTTARPFRYQVRNRFFQVVGGNQQLTWPVAVNSAAGMALACPAATAVPVVDLRFEDLPGATTFVDSSGFGNDAVCNTGCPATGLPGAPNAPLSDYAAKFNEGYDSLAINTAFADSFTVAMWIKRPSVGNDEAFLVEQGVWNARDWGLSISSGMLRLRIGGQVLTATGARIDNDQWHFVAATRDRTTGRVALYVNGTSVGTATFSTHRLTGTPILLIARDATNIYTYGGLIDHLQFFRTSFAADAVQALYSRTGQSYCVAAAVPATGTNFPWSRFGLTEQDTRGGRITATGGLRLLVDADKPTATITSVSNNEVVGAGQVIGGSATDARSGVRRVEVSVNDGAWQLATGANTWSFSLAGLSGDVDLRVRATDQTGNVGDPSAVLRVRIDTTAPIVSIDPTPNTIKPTKTTNNIWQVTLNGSVNDNLTNNLSTNTLLVKLAPQSGVGVAPTAQVGTVSGNRWTINYLLDPNVYDPTGIYTATVQVRDSVGLLSNIATGIVRLDAAGPVAHLATADATRSVISQTLTINGVISDTNSIAGIDKLEIAYTPIEQVVALPANLTSAEANARLNRTWHPVTLAQRGAGVANTTWSVAVPADLENEYQIDLRGTDLLGNVAISGNVWHGIIDTRAPRMVMTATATGASYFDTASNQTLNEIRFVCGAQELYLNEESFTCPGEGLAEPVRSFDNRPTLQALFPDLTIRTGLALSYTLWLPTTTPAAMARACDTFGRCAQASVGATAGAVAGAAAAAASVPKAVIVNPTGGSFVAAGNAISVTVAAEAGAGLKDVTIKLDNATVQTLSFAQSPAITRTVRTVNVPVATEGAHTLVAQATAWDNSTQTTLFPVVFTLDQNAPSLTIDASVLAIADTWQAQSGVLRFNGNASDSVGLAAVQIKEGDSEFADATFGNGTWRVALPVADPEGRTLNITVRAIDRAGRITTISQQIATDLSAADAPDTSITSGPATPSTVNTAQFVFAGSATAVAFDCQLDEGAYTSCTSPTTYNDLSKGSHTFRVRAIDSRGLPDLSPAQFTWTVNATALDATITSGPATPTSSRSASFAFSGNGASYECSLDGAAFAACVSPATYSGLSNGDHTFLVRARNGSNVGAAARHLWTVVNAVPVAASQRISTTQDKAVAITLTATDEDALTYRIVAQPDNGLLLGAPPALTYTPNTGFAGMDSFTFVASDGQSESAPTLVTINVGALPPPTTANLTIVLDTQPNTGINQGFTGSLGNFALDDITPDDNDGIPNRRTFTVAPGSYLVRRSTPLTWVPTAIVCTPTTGAAIDLNGSSVTLALAAGNNVTCTFTLARSVQLTARVFEDRVRTSTNLGKRNAGDPWLPGWTVTLFTAPAAPVATLVTEGTATAGLFEAVFRFLRPGAYMLCTTLPAGWTPTTPTAVDPAYGRPCKPVTLTGGQAATVLFGAYPPVVAAGGESFTPEEEVITDDDTISDLPEEATEAAPVETPVTTPVEAPVATPGEAPVTTPGAMVNQLFLPLAAR